ncbi:MAG: glycine cleavage system protein H [Candidatus Lloydbacteria bacterium RIFCSPHIGHO2_02_FULL_54_17]|uniref:Glycine cleavage system H protein n=1 Tax=Candidatus Lloydbacteria bacterium RIFCSPHIGHO2_02_FULL_54_17 TaxID=1798664 RepID=A0A1G2DI52_9BACT|nr:MAG: glycine cleavage system protein H [Candidatus Lloydbacteria bacterium RIFCSPHIGHO2_01_FULL_54_11]OGZ12641.1 MAG: glycine cleavage system protein H [Candidatus Lloydbacteria bacterium RIFCSPHIGHO2_02_FULL_54_17]OGZ13493.1 MAG: glycine cleavage system protein H [Candidatus Lloydbacteria bacterium RIFCSPLOWO2_01_FULL_54_18]OGZ14687.1 MAG: glycine cleavage system protein H [Candidatus Lloydbacteria bacterium RIFCSPLOWO2_02_FULL_54_12]
MRMMFTAEHEWISTEDGNIATVGITHYAQNALGDIVFVELPAIGSDLKKGEVSAVVESVKAASDIYMPVGGTVIEVNEALQANPALVNTDPMGLGWFFKIRLAHMDELDALVDKASYDKLVSNT